MDLQQWLKENMGPEYDPSLTTKENVTTLVAEVQHFRSLMKTLRVFVEDLTEWTEEYDEATTENVH